MKQFTQTIQEKFNEICKTGKLFRVKLSGDDIWNIYLKSFGDDLIFRDPESSEHNCKLCNNFIRRYGNIVSVDENYNITTMFDVNIEGEYKNAAIEISKAIKKSSLENVFFETYNELNSLNYEKCNKNNSVFRLGINKNVKRYTKEEANNFKIFEINEKLELDNLIKQNASKEKILNWKLNHGLFIVKPDEIFTFNHFFLDIPKEFVSMTNDSVESIMAKYRSDYDVFKRAMETISLDTLNLVKDLINQGSLLDGATHLYKIEQIIPLKKEYDELKKSQKDNWCWVKSYKLPFAKFRNELIGVLCTELSEGKELNDACKAWNIRVDPKNYMKATAPITKKQIEDAKKFVEENGYAESFNRRFATISDIKMSEILHASAESSKIKSVSIFDNVKSTTTQHKRNEFEGVEEVSIDKFMKDILPGCTSIEAFLENKHEGNMVSLTTANDPDSKRIMKWNNNYSWTFNGNLAGKSQIKEAVKSAGGRVDGVLRFSMIWNDTDGRDNSDLDAWCIQPNKQNIGFSEGFRKDSGNVFSSCGGQLDLDNRNPCGQLAIENIYFKDINKLKNGVYTFFVNQFSARNSQGFKAEIEFNGETYLYELNRPVSGNVLVAKVTFNDGKFTIEHLLPECKISSKEIYGLETNQFHKVNLLCLSPNHWDGNNVGNKHYFFMLDKCKSPNSIRSFHNENLLPELANHRKVLEVLGTINMIESTDKQLSGLGFNATVHDELLVKLSGNFKRMIKIKF